jgi:DNA-binding MarR family transcriptional regulator
MASRGSPFDEDELAAWHGMLRTHARVIRALDEQLTRRFGLAVSEFDVLITLDNAPERELRMSELADAVMLSPSGLTRLVARLERTGLVTRRQDTADARSFRTGLTPAGAELLSEARRTHNAVIRELYLDRLSAAQRKALGRAWRSVSG